MERADRAVWGYALGKNGILAEPPVTGTWMHKESPDMAIPSNSHVGRKGDRSHGHEGIRRFP